MENSGIRHASHGSTNFSDEREWGEDKSWNFLEARGKWLSYRCCYLLMAAAIGRSWMAWLGVCVS